LSKQAIVAIHQHADYPGVIPYEQSKILMGRALTENEKCLRGVVVSGLTARDISCLNYFEGDVSNPLCNSSTILD
jgi:hypothetical protein